MLHLVLPRARPVYPLTIIGRFPSRKESLPISLDCCNVVVSGDNMRKIFLIGAGKSTSSLIKYLEENAEKENWFVTIGDLSVNHIRERLGENGRFEIIEFDVFNNEQRESEIEKSNLVISMLPARFHHIVANDCINFRKHLVTASYVSDELKLLDKDAKNYGLIFLNELGVDPGIDHMSAMKLIDEIRDSGSEVTGFESFTGGLIAPESERDNPWRYKFTWNPRNVVIAAQGGAAKFLQEGKYKYIPYTKIFRRTEVLKIDGFGKFIGYANRDSLKYIPIYGLEGVKTFYRGTLRRPGFCNAWDIFVQLGMTDDSYIIEGSEHMTNRDFINSFLAFSPKDSVELKLQHYLHIDQDSDLIEKLEWLGIFEDTKIGLKDATPAQMLQHILEQKWTLEADDKDMVVMLHKINFIKKGKDKQIQSSMVVIGDDQTYTAMAKTVGIPVAIGTKFILNGLINTPGVLVPTQKDIYLPILSELEDYDITFTEKYLEID